MNGRRLTGAVTGGLVAGLGLTVVLMAQERRHGTPSELTELGRAAAARLELATPPADRLPAAGEQAAIQAGHLALSALAGAAYAATTDEDASVIASGIVFGLAFYAVAHWIAGPALGLKAPEWRADTATLGMHATNHILFGLVTAAAARAADA